MKIISYSFKTALKSIMMEKWVNFLTVLSISIGLSIICTFVMLSFNMDSALKRWARSFGVIVYLNENINEKREAALNKYFMQDADILEVNYISKEQALEDVRKTLGGNAIILDVFNNNPLPSSFELELKGNLLDPSSIRKKGISGLR